MPSMRRSGGNLEVRSIESLIDLPKATAPEPIAAMRLLAALMPPAYQTDINLYYLVLCRMTDLSLTYGITKSPLMALDCSGGLSAMLSAATTTAIGLESSPSSSLKSVVIARLLEGYTSQWD